MKKMRMEVQKSVDSEVYTYCSIEDALSECHRITNKKTGVSIKSDGELKLSYTRMRKRFDFFNNNGGEFYDSIETLWKSCTGSKSTFEDRIKKLKKVGLVTSVGKKGAVQKHTVAAMNPNDFLLERNDPVLGWVNCLDYPVFGSKRPQEPHKVEEQETEAVKERPAQELPQQTATKPALPSYDEDLPDFAKQESHCEQQIKSPTDDNCASPTASKMKLVMTEIHLEDFDDDDENEDEDEEIEDWEVIDEKPSLTNKLSPIRQAMRDQLDGDGKGKKVDYTEHIDF